MAASANQNKFTTAPLMWSAAAFAAGIAGAKVVDPDIVVFSALAVLLFAAAVVLNVKRPSGVAVLIAFVFIGALCFQFEKHDIGPDRLRVLIDSGRIPADTPIEMEGRLVDKVEPAYEGVFLTLDVHTAKHQDTPINISGRLRVFVSTQTDAAVSDLQTLGLRYGSRIRIIAIPDREDRFLNPGAMPRKEILERQHVDAAAALKSPLLIEKLADGTGFAPLAFVFERRQDLINEFREHFSVSTAGVMTASLLGGKNFLDRPTADVFREGGTFHILVISGLHITFIGGITLLFVGLFTKDPRLQFAAACSFLWVYTVAVGAEAPVVRASIMFTVLLGSRVVYRDGSLINSLGACCLLLLVWRPNDLFDPSFQLTIVSVAAIVGMAFPLIQKMRAVGKWIPTADEPFPPNVSPSVKRICEILYWRERVWEITASRQIWSGALIKGPFPRLLLAENRQAFASYIVEGLLVSLIVQIWLLPFLVIYFHRVSVASIFLNLWVGIVIAFESFAALLAILFAQFSETLAIPLVGLTEMFNWLLVSVPAFFVNMGLASLRVPVYSGPMKALYLVYLIPVIVLSAIVYRWDPFLLTRPSKVPLRTASASAAVFLIFGGIIIFHPFSSPTPEGNLRVDFLDVGQGDSALVTFPNGETMLIDGGGRFDFNRDRNGDQPVFEPDVPRIGEAVVSEFLWEKGYSKVDHIVATHADADHTQGLVDIVRNFSVGAAYMDAVSAEDEDARELYETVRRYNVPIREPTGRFEAGGAVVDFLQSGGSVPAGFSDNNRSTVIRITFGRRVFLFTGDIEADAEELLLRSAGSLKADVVKAAHHGSRTSSTQGFVDAAAANIVIIPVGRRSMFGHPHAEVVKRWTRAGAKVMTTGESGTVTFITDGNLMSTMTFAGGGS